MATTQEAVQVSAIVPSLTVDDLQKSITFYEALGFAIDERWKRKGTLLGVMLRRARSEIGLSQDDWKKGRDRKKGNGGTLVHLDDAGSRRRDRQASQERRHHADVGASRHGVEEPRVRGQRSERFSADDLLGDTRRPGSKHDRPSRIACLLLRVRHPMHLESSLIHQRDDAALV